MAPMSFNHTDGGNFVSLLEASEGLGERGSYERQVYASTRSSDSKHTARGQRPHETEKPQVTSKQ